MTPSDIRAYKPITPHERMLHEALLELLAVVDTKPGSVTLAEPPALAPETVSRACDCFHGATFYIFQSKPVTGYEAQFRAGIEEAIRASRETQP